MPKLSELMADEAPLTIPFELGELHVVYRPRVVTPEWQTAIGKAEMGDDYEPMLYGPLKEALVSWDLENSDGAPYPITSESMATIPRHILTNLLVAVIRTARPNYQRLAGVSTAGSSEPSAPTKIRRTGTS